MSETEIGKNEKYHQPKFSLAELSDQSGVPQTTLRGWVDKDLLKLDADERRIPGKHRRFSDFDVFKVLVAHSVARQGVAAAYAARAAKAATIFMAGVFDGHQALCEMIENSDILYVDVSEEPGFCTADARDPRASSFITVRALDTMRFVASMNGEILVVFEDEREEVEKLSYDERAEQVRLNQQYLKLLLGFERVAS